MEVKILTTLEELESLGSALRAGAAQIISGSFHYIFVSNNGRFRRYAEHQSHKRPCLHARTD